MSVTKIALAVALGLACCVPAALAQQPHRKPLPSTTAPGSLRPSLIQPRAVAGPAAGVYCPDMTEGAFGVHDLGWIPAGLNVEVNVESFSDGFDPVATVFVATMGTPGANTVKMTTFYDNDSGGGKDAKVTFVAPQAGTYVLLVADISGDKPGCYRYQAAVR